MDRDILLKKLKINMQEKEILFKHLYNVEFPSVEDEADKLFEESTEQLNKIVEN